LNNRFERMWESNKDHVRRILLAVTEDLDLTEDLLQDTYLRARAGMSGYRGGSEKVWLATIARNVFFSHARCKSFRSEESLDVIAELADDSPRVDSDDYLTLLLLREAMNDLNPAQREALIMRHYGDCAYEEIAEHLSCTPTTAKHRVWRAMQRLRSVIASCEEGLVQCSELRGPKIIDWLYGALSQRESAAIESHITLCAPCRKNLSEVRRLSAILDKDQGNRRICTLIDLDERGCTTRYVWVKRLNENKEPVRTFVWHLRPGWELDYLALQGQPVDWWMSDVPKMGPGSKRFEGRLPTPVSRGGMVDAMFIVRPLPLLAGSEWEAQLLGNNVWHYHHKHSPFPDHQGVFIVTIRLPSLAKLVSVDPKPQKVSTRTGRISLTWRVITRVVGDKEKTEWQFEADVDYALGVAQGQDDRSVPSHGTDTSLSQP